MSQFNNGVSWRTGSSLQRAPRLLRKYWGHGSHSTWPGQADTRGAPAAILLWARLSGGGRPLAPLGARHHLTGAADLQPVTLGGGAPPLPTGCCKSAESRPCSCAGHSTLPTVGSGSGASEQRALVAETRDQNAEPEDARCWHAAHVGSTGSKQMNPRPCQGNGPRVPPT